VFIRGEVGFPITAMTRDHGDVGDLTVAQIELCYFTFYLLSRRFSFETQKALAPGTLLLLLHPGWASFLENSGNP
jgi:hypothetical protein